MAFTNGLHQMIPRSTPTQSFNLVFALAFTRYPESLCTMLSPVLPGLVRLALLLGLAHGGSLSGRSTETCNNGEGPGLLCYNQGNGTPQNVAVDDVTYIASYLRAYGAQTRAGRLFTMSASDAPDCAEWTLY